MNYVDPDGLWRRVGETIWEAESGDTLWGLAVQARGDGRLWTQFKYQYNAATLKAGDIIDINGGGLVGHNYGDRVEFFGSVPVYPVAEEVTIYVYNPSAYETPIPPSKPTASGGSSNPTPAKPNPDSISSISGPGSIATGMSSGGSKPSGGNTGFGLGKKDPSLDFYGPQLPPIYVQPVKESMINGEGGPFSGVLHTADAILDALPDVDTAAAGAYLLDFEKIGDTYHAKFDCWQSKFGYNDLYDFAFDSGTSMKKEKFEFESGGKEYVLWAWKGDYINLGAGAELGIYERATFLGLKLPHWNVNKDLAMKMSLRVYYNGNSIIYYAPEEKQWWITGFNPNYKNVTTSQLTVTIKVTFNSKTMYNDFYNTWCPNRAWSFDGKKTATLRF